MSRSHSSSFGIGHYLLTWLALVILGVVSFGLVFASLGPWSMTVALVIAGVKALLVVLVFMHLWYHRGSMRLAAAFGLGFVLLLVILMTVDVQTRT